MNAVAFASSIPYICSISIHAISPNKFHNLRGICVPMQGHSVRLIGPLPRRRLVPTARYLSSARTERGAPPTAVYQRVPLLPCSVSSAASLRRVAVQRETASLFHQLPSAKVSLLTILARCRCRPASPCCTEASASCASSSALSNACSASNIACRRWATTSRLSRAS